MTERAICSFCLRTTAELPEGKRLMAMAPDRRTYICALCIGMCLAQFASMRPGEVAQFRYMPVSRPNRTEQPAR